MIKISSGKLKKPVKMVIYGTEGIGKTTLASKAPDPLFIDTEGGTAQMDVRRIDGIDSWTSLLNAIDEVRTNPQICKTLVLDTADWAEIQCINHILERNDVKSIEAFGFGKGYTYIGEEFSKLLNHLDRCIDAGLNVIVNAHAKMRKFEQPDEMGAYDRWELKLSRQVAPLLKEWADALLFANYKTVVFATDKQGTHHKAQGGKRVLYTAHHPCWDAKNRFGLPECIDMDYANIAALFDIEKNAAPPTVHERLLAQLEEAGVTVEQFTALCESKNFYPSGTPIEDYTSEFLELTIFPYFARVIAAIKNN